jgi:hypothetical protein
MDERKPRGVRWTSGGDFALRDVTFTLSDDGEVSGPPPRVEMRTDMWPFWLEEAIDAAVLAAESADQIPTLTEQLATTADPAALEHDIDDLMFAELKASMRAVTASAFAIDAFYASIKERSPEHPDQNKWRDQRTARYKQVAESFKYHLKINNHAAAEEFRRRISEVFRFRDWAVHPGAKFRGPEYREDRNLLVDWHFVAFRRENAIRATVQTVSMLDVLVAALDRGSDDLKRMKEYSRRKMDEILDACEAIDAFAPIGRAEPPSATEPTPPSPAS